MRRTGFRVFGIATALAAVVVASAAAFAPVGPATGFRLTGADGNTAPEVVEPDVVYNSVRHEYLVAYTADVQADNEFEVYAQRVDTKGQRIGGRVRVSNVGTDGDDDRDGSAPSVAYNGSRGDYLVVFHGDGLADDNEREIYGQRLSATGAPIGADDFRISTVFDDGDIDRGGFDADVAYNTKANQFLVTWEADGLATDQENEIFGQRLGPTGGELAGDFRISNVGPEMDPDFDARDAAVAYGPKSDQYLVIWEGDPQTDDENEIFGQRISAAGSALGGDFRISLTGSDGDPDRDAIDPRLAFNSKLGQFLVVWRGDALPTEDEDEVFGRRLSSIGARVGGQFRISTTFTDGNIDHSVTSPDVAYSTRANEYLVAWEGDGLATSGKFEIFAQRIGPTGQERDGDFRVSFTGADDDASLEAENAALGPGVGQYLAAWDSDVVADDDFEAIGRLIVAKRCFGKAATRVGTSKRDVIKGTRKRDVIVGLGGPDKLIGRRGNDLLCGNKGRDKLIGGPGRDRTRR